jgi:hypothetical protein
MPARNRGRVIFVSSESAVQIPSEMIHYGVTRAFSQFAKTFGTGPSRAGVLCVLDGFPRGQFSKTIARRWCMGVFTISRQAAKNAFGKKHGSGWWRSRRRQIKGQG